MSEFVEISVLEKKVDANLIKFIRSFSPLSHSIIIDRIKNGQAVYSKNLKKEEFYNGIDEVLKVIELCEKQAINTKITINGSEIDKSYLANIKRDLSHISLEDFR